MALWYLKAFFHELAKLKIRAMWWYLTDPSFRQEIVQLREHIPFKEYKLRLKFVHYAELQPSHRVIYPEWVDKLVNDIQQGARLEPIHCVEIGNTHKVVDGHHRLAAIHKAPPPETRRYIPVFIREYQ